MVFYFFRTALTWPEAEKSCEINGYGTLAPIVDRDVQGWLINMLNNQGYTTVWTGLMTGYGNLSEYSPTMQYIGQNGNDTSFILSLRESLSLLSLGCYGQGCCGMLNASSSTQLISACYLAANFVCSQVAMQLGSVNVTQLLGKANQYSKNVIIYTVSASLHFYGASYTALASSPTSWNTFNATVQSGTANALDIDISQVVITNITNGSIVVTMAVTFYGSPTSTVSSVNQIMTTFIDALQGDVSSIFGTSFTTTYGITYATGSILSISIVEKKQQKNLAQIIVPCVVVPITVGAVAAWLLVYLKQRARLNPEPVKGQRGSSSVIK